MATSQNGWSVYTSSSGLAPFRWITGRVRPGDVYTIFDYLCRRFDAEVEKIIVPHSWGYAYRAVRGQTSGFSNHASGTALDLNAPAHPLGKRGTFSSSEVAAIRRILRELDGAVRWGGDYSSRADEMHFEINASAAHVAAVARKIKGAPVKPPVDKRPTVSLKAARNAAQTPVWRTGLGKPGLNARWRIRKALSAERVVSYAAWQRKLGYKGDDANGIPGRESLTKLGNKRGFRVVA